MKIETNRTGLDTAALQRLNKAAEATPAGRTSNGRQAGDRVDLSSDAALAGAAAKAAHDAPEVRTDLVRRMRAALEAGTLGADAGSLADRLLDRMTESKL